MEIVKSEVEHIAVIDIETGGFDKLRSGIVEIGVIVATVEGQYVYGWSSVIKPYKMADGSLATYGPNAEKVHGVTVAEMNATGFPAEKVAESFCIVMNHYKIKHVVGHNVRKFDLPRIESFLKLFGYSYTPEKISDTLEMSRNLHPKLPKHNLTAMRDYYQITQANTHRALSDAYVTMELYRKLLNE